MLKKTITYKDYNGNERTEDFYFNLSEAELMEMQLSTTGGLAEYIKQLVSLQDQPAILQIFQKIIKQAYGRKSADGREFEKSDALTRSFCQTEAYSQLFVELATNAKAAAEFINGIVPAKMSKKLETGEGPVAVV